MQHPQCSTVVCVCVEGGGGGGECLLDIGCLLTFITLRVGTFKLRWTLIQGRELKSKQSDNLSIIN